MFIPLLNDKQIVPTFAKTKFMKALSLIFTFTLLSSLLYGNHFLVSPTKKDFTTSNQPFFTWTNGTIETTEFRLYVDSNKQVYNSTEKYKGADTIFELQIPLSNPGTYYWGVAAFTATDTIYSVVNSFTYIKSNTGAFFDTEADSPVIISDQFSSIAKHASIEIVDLNNDSYQDIISADRNAECVFFQLNINGSSFGTEQCIDSISSISKVSSADINNDGFYDIISYIYDRNSIQFYLNNGDGTFKDPVVIGENTPYITTIVPADINGDGYIDILVGESKSSGSISVFKNLGNETFADIQTITNPTYSNGFKIGDLDNDGDPDILFVDDKALSWLKNDGNGNFKEYSILRVDFETSFDIADADGDGDLDIFAVQISTVPHVYRIINYGNGNFYSEKIAIKGDYYTSFYDIKACDLNGDDSPDLLCGALYDQGSSSGLIWAEYDKTTDEYIQKDLPPTINGYREIEVSDIDNDGDTDIINQVGGNGIFQFALLENDPEKGGFKQYEISLNQGWNIIGLSFTPVDATPKNVFKNSSVVKSTTSSYMPSRIQYLNSIHSIYEDSTYIAYSSENNKYTVTGRTNNSVNNIDLKKGWNYITIKSEQSIPLASLPSEVQIIKDFDEFYDKKSQSGTLEKLDPNKSYFVFSTNNTTIQF